MRSAVKSIDATRAKECSRRGTYSSRCQRTGGQTEISVISHRHC
jgi:hypothetical protein